MTRLLWCSLMTRWYSPRRESCAFLAPTAADLDPSCSLAQTAVHSPDILAPLVETGSIANTGDTSLLEIYTSLCESPAADPGPYDPDALINARMRTALQGGRAEELQRLAGMWRLDETMDEAEWQDKIGEMGVLATLLACATDPPGAGVKVDFFLVSCRV